MADVEVSTGHDGRPSFGHHLVHEVFEERAATAPAANAVDGPDEALSYGALNEWANRLARLLQERGAGPEVAVGLYLPRGTDFVVAQLATLKAGAAYVALDVADPPARTGEMLRFAGASLRLTSARHAGRIDDPAEELVIDALDLREQPGEDLRVPVDPANLAYVVFTSGSTGRPKPVAVTHGALANHLSAIRDRYALTTVDRVLQFANPAFDVVAEEVFPTLGTGGCVLIPSGPAMAPAELQRFVDSEGVTVANLPTSYWTQWTLELEALGDPPPACLRLLVVGTEKAPTATLARWWKHSDVPVVNSYGLSETTITVASRTFLSGEVPGTETLPIGTPVSQCEAFVYDAELGQVSPGAPGELWISGEALARGYAGLPGLTAERFLPHPERHGAVLFRTGDLARVLPDGAIEILGRVDRQVKIRGHRVEPSEVEIALRSHPDVGHSYVRPEGDPESGGMRLVAYVTPADVKRIPSARSLREGLREAVPDYMVPAGYVVLPALPLRPNGKVDEDALPAPDPHGGRVASTFSAPRTETERWLVDAWQEVLFVERVGINDDFFELGGHSIAAMQLVARIRSAFEVELAAAQVISTTPRLLALEIESLRRTPDRRQLPSVEHRQGETTAPLSFQQEQVWFHTKLAPESIAYQTQTTIRVVGPFDVDVFERAVTEVVKRHEILRTVYREVDGQPEQVVLPPQPAPVTRVDLTTLPPDRIRDELDVLTRKELRTPFDLSRLPLMRWTAVSLGPEEHELVLVEHHMVHDGWSFALLMRELTALYDAFDRGEESPLEDLPLQYRHYARWEREAIDSEAMLARRATWAETLQGITRSPELPPDRKRQEFQRFVGETIRSDLPPGLPASLRDYCREERATPFAVMFATFALVVSRYTGETDVAVSSAFANRNVAQTEQLIGMFVNPVLLRCDLEGVPTFRDLTRRVHEVVLSAAQNQEFPFNEVVRMLNPVRDATRNPLVGLMFSFNDAPLPQVEFGGASGTVFEATNGSAKTDLNVVVMPRAQRRMGVTDRIDDRITLLWEFNSDLFDTTTIENLVSHYENLLEAGTADPARPLSELDLMSPPERHHVVVELNDTAIDFPAGSCIHELFEAQALETPEAIALVADDDDGALTYRGLDAAANRLAHYLVDKGVGPEVRVGICLERGTDLVVGLLGILKAGGAYVPLDPDYPSERLKFMLEDTAAPVVVTSSAFASRLDDPAAELVLLDAERDAISNHPGTNPAPTATPQDLAYVIYTSGSTGAPKGVMVPHRGVCNRLVWMQREYGLGPGDAVLQKTPFTFDVSVWELFGPLVTGARLVMARPGGHKDPQYLADAIDRHGITVVHFVPSMLTPYLAQAPARHNPRLTICSGEALSPQAVRDFKKRFNGDLHNLYGPTEGSIEVTFHPCEDDGADTVPIGRPIANIAIYVLDAHGNPVPKGVPGELYIGGTGVVRGYLNRPALTAERFVPDPFSSVPGARLYRTGDRARFLRNGDVEFLGRVDDQVKIRGFRIEPGEIEACLTTHEAIREAVVVPASRDDGDVLLAAYFTTRGSSNPPALPELRAHLGKSLPEYMVPSHFVVLDEIPLNPSGKLDRAALPAPEVSREVDAAYVAPRTRAEEVLAEIWCDVLGVERVGVHDNFYELGGDSILNLQIVARANAAGLGLTPRLLFQHQTVAALAAVAGERAEISAEQGRVAGEVPLTPIQRWFFERDLPDRHHFNQSRLLSADGSDPGLVAKTLAAVVDHHDALRLRFARTEDGWTQRNASVEDGDYFSVIDLSADSDPERALESACTELHASLDLERGPLLRAAWFDLGGGRALLFVCVHHLAVDGVSWRILLEDLDSAYGQLTSGDAIALPAKTTSFRQWAERLTAYASSDEALSEVDYWAEAAAESFELPVDHDLGPNDEASTDQVTVALDTAETEALLRDVPAGYRTQVNDILVAALARALASWTGEDRIVVDLEGHGREDLFDGVDLTRTVGWFTSLFSVALEVDTASPSGLLKTIKEQLRAVPRRGLGHGVLRYLASNDARERVAAQSPLSFNYLGRFGPETQRSSFSPVPGPTGPGRAPSGARPHLVEVDGRVSDGTLQMTWTYSRNLHRRSTIEKVAAGFVAALRELVAHCSYERAGGVTPSDFPLAGLDQHALDELWDKGVVSRQTQDVYPLTPVQHGMVFHTLYEPGAATYFQQWTFTVTGPVDAGAFERAWRETCAAHDALRSSVLWEGLEAPVQVVTRDVAPSLEAHDWSDLDPDVRQEHLDTFLAHDRARGFDLAAPPLMRLALLRTGAESAVFVWSFHHVLLDGWSAALVRAEVMARYHALVREESYEVADAPHYRDFVEWLNERDAAADKRYWRDRLAGFAAPTPLPYGGDTGSDEPRRHAFELDEDATAILDELARRARLTLSTIVQAAWALLLSRYSGEDDVVFGATVSGRPPDLPGVQDIVGLFINTVPVRVAVDGSSSVGEWLERIQADAAERSEFENAALTDIHSWSDVPPRTSLFDSIVVFESYPGRASGVSDAEPTLSDLGGFERTNYPLTLVARPGAALSFDIAYDGSRFTPATVARMAEHLQNVLRKVAADPGRPLSELELLSEPERHHVLVELNDAAAGHRGARFVHELFEARAKESSDSVAVAFGDQELTYRELNDAANRLAHHLIDKGVGPEVPVGVCLERGPDLVMSLLAIFKAGGAYVPLDPAYPSERLAFILEDTGAPLVVTSARLAGSLDARVVLIDDHVISNGPDTNPTPVASPSDLAYVIYTSGSTGTPKGVAVAHGPLAEHCVAMAEHYGLTSSDRVLVFGSFNFDVTLEQTLTPLTTGASIVLRDADVWDPRTLADKVASYGITFINPPTAYWHQLADDREVVERLSASPSLRLVAAGGEAMTASRLQQWLEATGGRLALLNNYGPTEATITATSYEVTGTDALHGDTVPIGRRVSNSTVYVLDRYGNPVPIGVPGELCIGGTGVARGYLNRAALTAERFVPDPYAGIPGARLYRTGDRARYLEDGNVEFLGRIDHQVKVRGFRIEPGEIEARLSAHEAVREAVVVALSDGGAGTRLVAYCTVLDSSNPPGPPELRAHAAKSLPDYMVPAHFVVLDELPLTPNGKVDRAALPGPEGRPQLDAVYAAPRTPAEEVLAGIWSEVLGFERVGIHDDFFELGGHSLVATQVVSRIRGAFSVELPLRALFDSPTIAGLAEVVAGGERRDVTTIEPAPRDSELPLSFAQQRLWFLDQLEPGSAEYNVPDTLRVRGALDVDALGRALTDVVARHETLRTTFTATEGEPAQVIHEPGEFPLEFTDLSHLDAETRELEARRIAAAEAERPFDLETGPLLRADVLRLDQDDHVLLLNMHHIASDGWSRTVLLDELGALYDAHASGRPAHLDEMVVQYADFASWQRRRLTGDVLEGHLDYWRERLAGLPPVLDLPTDRPRPPVRSGRGATVSFEIDPDTVAALKALSRAHNATPFMTLTAAFQTLLARYSGSDDVAIGTPVAGRSHPEVEPLIGFFVNTLVLRTDLSGDPRFSDLVGRVRDTALGAYAHQDLPFEKLVEELHPQRSLSHTPLFQVMLSLDNAAEGALALGDASVERVPLDHDAAKFDLHLALRESENGIEADLQYSTDLFDAATAERMAGHLQNLLKAVAAEPDAALSELGLLSPSELHHLVVELNDTATDYPDTSPVHELFEARVRETPDAIALAFGDDELDYAELNRRANRLAHHLMDKGVGVETPVGICLERGPDLVVGLLAILKAGGAYVPLDPDYPAERLAFMIEDTAAPVVVTTSDLAGRLDTQGSELVLLDANHDVISARPDTDPTPTASAGDLAYVIYTSGSTGIPKGVAVTHANVVRLVTADYVDVSRDDVFLQLAPVSFDASTFEIWVPLLHGARMAIAVRGVVAPEDVAWTIEHHGVTVAWLTASLFNLVVETAPGGLKHLRRLLAGGESLSPKHVATALELLPETRLVNGYGPTESTTFTCCHEISDVPDDGSSVPIGRPISNTTVYVLDAYGNPVPKGVPGELFVGGAGVARGYVNRPGLTAERFVPDPFSSVPGARLYGTGDWVRYLPHGNVEFLGRVDHQLKIRGFRIEPGEIEACLVAHEAIRDAVVVARSDGADKRLVAYLVGDDVPTTTELRAHVSRTLPGYMVPGLFMVLDELPLTPNGKLDRAALPEPEGRPELEVSFVAPRTPAEQMLAGIWREVLGLERVGVHDDFFELGGHSLLATQVVSRTREAFDVELPLRALFESPTVAGLAARVAGSEQRDVPAIEPVPRDSDLPLSFAQQRLWFLDQLEPSTAEYNVPYALRVRGPLDVDALGTALTGVVARHETLRTTFATVDGEPVQVVHAPRDFPLEVTELSHLERDKRELEARGLAAAEAQRPFDLERGPLLRARVLRLDDDDHVLILNMHHIVSDGWSRSVLLNELSTLYDAHVSGRDPRPAELPIQYADFAAWQRRWLSGEVLEGQLGYWRERLAGLTPVLELPADRPRPAVRSERGATVSFEVDSETLAALRTFSRARNATLFMTLTAAFQTLLSRYSGAADVAVGIPIAGRSHPEVEPLIGFFVNTLVLRTDLSGDPSFSELVRRVRDVALGAYAHQDLPFEKLVEELQPQRSLSHTPLFQVMLSLDNTAEGSLKLGGATAERVPLDFNAAKFDLQLGLIESGGGLVADLQYSTDLFERATVERMAAHLQNVLKAIATDPDRALSEVDLLSEAERHHLVVELNDTAAGYPDTSLVHELFEARVEETPDAVAVVFGDEELDYAELNRRANRLAHHLVEKGVRAEVPVGVCLERGPDLVVSLLAILKAGGAYVPLDPDYPAERLAFMLEDTGAPLVVTSTPLAGHLGAEVVPIDDHVISTRPDTNPEPVASPDDLAYVIYTSGSTGTPKGVAVAHRGMCNLARAQIEEFGVQRGQAVMQFSSIGFDASISEVLMALLSGARLCIRPQDESFAGDDVVAQMKAQGVNVATLTPTALASFPEAELPDLHTLVSAGESCPSDLAARWSDGRRFFNAYGPTESTVCASVFLCDDASRTGTVPIGRPISNTTTYVLDPYGNPVPQGVAGELYVGGAGVARGYLNRPALTAQSFVPDPFSGVAGARLYRTGDRARHLHDGNLEFLGRVDDQVKIRGFRIEPGEIAARLAAHEAIREAVVSASADGGDERLVAYLTALDSSNPPGPPELRAHLSRTLPGYMVPASFVVLDELPLTPNGKLDRGALPAPEGRPDLQQSFVAPRTPAEEALAGIWCEVLGLERVGVHDDFFELGGHSLLATQVASRTRALLDVDVRVRSLFEAPTVEALAAHVEELVLAEVEALPAGEVTRELIELERDAGEGEETT
nr:AMP-dependent synthetase and ligase [uncultured bacterium]